MDSTGNVIHFWRITPLVLIKYSGLDITLGSQSSKVLGWHELEDMPGEVQDLLVCVKYTTS